MDRIELLKLYQGLRVTDVCDGLDAVGLIDTCTMDWTIRPVWRDMETFAHRFYGFAHTIRYVPTNRVVPNGLSVEDWVKWKSEWYRNLSPDPQQPIIPGEVLVVDGSHDRTTGFLGSHNTLKMFAQGMRGFVSNAGARDTDESIRQKVPIYAACITKGWRPGRLELDGENIPVAVGGVRVIPGDLVVADGDGVIVVPIDLAEQVGKIAREIANDDKTGRKRLYENAGMRLDDTLDLL
jgi:regulator of RNase E activity RraA